jgi:hypothetical protein
MFSHFKIVGVQIYFVDATAPVSFGLSRVKFGNQGNLTIIYGS